MEERKSGEQTIFNTKVILHERSAGQVMDIMNWAAKHDINNPANALFINAQIISDSLSFWINQKPFFTRWYYRWKFSTKRLIRGLSQKQLTGLINFIGKDLEDLEIGQTFEKKKESRAPAPAKK